MDSSGLRGLLIAQNKPSADGNELRIAAASRNVSDLIERTGLRNHLPIGRE
jgi:anti-anti-sigma factor